MRAELVHLFFLGGGGGESNDGTDGADTSSRGIFEHEGKLAFIHHKKVTIICNFTSSVASIFEANSVVGYIFDILSNQRQW